MQAFVRFGYDSIWVNDLLLSKNPNSSFWMPSTSFANDKKAGRLLIHDDFTLVRWPGNWPFCCFGVKGKTMNIDADAVVVCFCLYCRLHRAF